MCEGKGCRMTDIKINSYWVSTENSEENRSLEILMSKWENCIKIDFK